jgi:uncharacterized membrane protein
MTQKHKIALVTFSLFLAESLIHYNISKKESGENKDKFFVFPPLQTTIKMATTTALITLLSVIIIGEIKN